MAHPIAGVTVQVEEIGGQVIPCLLISWKKAMWETDKRCKKGSHYFSSLNSVTAVMKERCKGCREET